MGRPRNLPKEIFVIREVNDERDPKEPYLTATATLFDATDLDGNLSRIGRYELKEIIDAHRDVHVQYRKKA